jgi:1-acyl-sn-glycerol-3-phosphate acyltransferase
VVNSGTAELSRRNNIARSAIFVLFLVITVMPWAIVGLIYSIFVRGEKLYWYFAGWLRLAIWGARVICGVKARVQGRENLPGSSVILLPKHQSTWVLWYTAKYPLRLKILRKQY